MSSYRTTSHQSSDGLRIAVISLIAVVVVQVILVGILFNGFVKQGAVIDQMARRDACIAKIARDPYRVAGVTVPLQRSLEECYLPTPPAKQ